MLISILASLLLSVQVPDGYHVEVFARNLEHPQGLLVLEDGTVLVARPAMNDVIALRDTDGDGRADQMRTAVASIERARALAMRGRTLHVAAANRVVAAERLPDGSFGDTRNVVENLSSRAIAFGADGKLYAVSGSAPADPEHATLLQLDADGMSRRIFARGLDAAALVADAQSGNLWGAGGGELNRIGDGLHYGWPYCDGKQPFANVAAPEGMTKEKLCRSSEAAALALPADATAIAFHEGEAFAGGGSKIVRIRFENGKPRAAEEFASGANEIAGLASAPDGALYVSDAAGSVVYRVTRGTPAPQTMISSAAEPAATPVLARAYRVAGLSGPDAVVHDEEQDVYFVSNVDGAIGAKDGKGFISRVTPNGKIAERKFIDGLDAPKGLAVRGTELWVADIDVVRAFDRVTGAETKTIDLAPHGAVFLQGLAVGPDDAIYVTDTDIRFRGQSERLPQGDGRIFRVAENGAVEVAFEGEELRSPSGIVWDGTRFLIAQAYGNDVLAWNRGMGTKAVLRGPGAFDGIVVLPNGAVIVSSHYDESLHVGRSGVMRPLFTRKPSPGDIAFDRKRNLLLIPSIDGDWLEAWTLPPLDAPATTAKEGVKEVARR